MAMIKNPNFSGWDGTDPRMYIDESELAPKPAAAPPATQQSSGYQYSNQSSAAGQAAQRFNDDWNGFFSDAVSAGTRVDLGNGTYVTKNADGTATYGGNGRTFMFDQNTNKSYVGRNAPGLQAQWDANYSASNINPVMGERQQTTAAASGFTINADGTVTRQGTNPNAAPQTFGGSFTTRHSISDVTDPAARAWFEANPINFYNYSALGRDPLQAYYDAHYNGGSFNREKNGGGLLASGGGTYGVGPGGSTNMSGGSGVGSSGGGAQGGTAGGQYSPTTQTLRPQATIEGRINALLARDQYGQFTNAVVKQAADGAMASFASRGLLNSSMAQQAAYEAATRAAIEIAGPDAQAYFQQERANQDASNVFSRAEQDNAFDVNKFNQTLQLEWSKLGQQDRQFYAGLQARMDELRLSNENQTLASQVALQSDLAKQNNAAVHSQYDLFVRRLAQIDADTNLDAAAKAKQKQEAAENFKQIASYYGVMSDFDLNFGTQEPQP